MNALRRKDSSRQIAALIRSDARASALRRKHGISGRVKKSGASFVVRTHIATNPTATSTGLGASASPASDTRSGGGKGCKKNELYKVYSPQDLNQFYHRKAGK